MTSATRIGAGFGCRRGCEVDDVLGALARALAEARRELSAVASLFAPEFKRDERGLWLAAERLQKPLRFLSLAQLRAQASAALTQSEAALRSYGLPSIAETTALAGAAELAAERAAARMAREAESSPSALAAVKCEAGSSPSAGAAATATSVDHVTLAAISCARLCAARSISGAATCALAQPW
jgi:cobalt-precorrin 5A hydrolase